MSRARQATRVSGDVPKQKYQIRSEANRKEAAELGLRDLYFFNRVILGNPVLHEPLHRPVCEWLETWGKPKKLFLMPRGHVKSNIGTVGMTCQMIAREPNVRILIASHKHSDAKKFMRLIKRYLSSDRFTYFYPNIRPRMNPYTNKPEVWRDDAILVDRPKDLVESTVESSSTDAVVTGRHYDFIHFDDLVTSKSVSTPGEIQKTREFHESCEALLNPGARELITGTRYDFSDRYGDILETATIRDLYEILNYSAFQEFNDSPESDYALDWLMQNGTPIYPLRFTIGDDGGGEEDNENVKKSLPKILAGSGAHFFNTQYMNRPQDPTKQIFTEALLQRMYADKFPTEGELNYFRVCDLSGENETKESFTAIVTGCVDSESCIYITDIIRGNFTASWIMEELFRGQELPDEVRPKLVGFEPSMFEKVLKNIMQREGVSRGTYVPVKMLPIGVARKSKPDRIRGLEAWISNNKFKVLKNCRNKHLLHSELYRHPATKAVDIADACAQIPTFMFPGTGPRYVDKSEDDTLPLDIVYGLSYNEYIGSNRGIDESLVSVGRM